MGERKKKDYDTESERGKREVDIRSGRGMKKCNRDR